MIELSSQQGERKIGADLVDDTIQVIDRNNDDQVIKVFPTTRTNDFEVVCWWLKNIKKWEMREIQNMWASSFILFMAIFDLIINLAPIIS